MELEKKLTELGNRVSTVVGDLSRVNDYFGPTDLFIFNLPNKIADDTNELMTLVNIANMVIASNARMIMVGEKELRPQLLKIYTGLSHFVWVFRPVEMDELTSAIGKAIGIRDEESAGPQVLQMLRQDPDTAGIPVVFLTGVGTREGVARVMELKPDGYILKSTSRENLLSFLQSKLGG